MMSGIESENKTFPPPFYKIPNRCNMILLNDQTTLNDTVIKYSVSVASRPRCGRRVGMNMRHRYLLLQFDLNLVITF